MPYNLEILHRVAILYYIDHLKQESIGRKLKMSKYTVNRLLKKARDKGLIKVQVLDPNNKYNGLK